MNIDARARELFPLITPGAAVACHVRGGGTLAFLRQVETAGTALAKLNVPPPAVVEALDDYDDLIAAEASRIPDDDRRQFDGARQQLLFCTILALNEAYHRVREIESQTLHEIFRIELEAGNADVLYRGFIELLAEAFRAKAGHLFLFDSEAKRWTLKASSAHAVSKNSRLHVPDSARLHARLRVPRTIGPKEYFDPSWAPLYPCGWSMPMVQNGRVAGVLQFGFDEVVERLPRDEHVINAAVERCLAAAARARLVEDLSAREERIRDMAERMLHVEEMERRRISRELHDHPGQSLVTIRLQMEMIEMSLSPKDQEIAARLADVRNVTEKTILDIRRLISDLSPTVLGQFGLESAVRQLLKRLQTTLSCSVKLTTHGVDKVTQKLQIIVYRIIQECCTNIGKHSEASNVNISISSADGVLSLEVQDDGRGFSVEEALRKSDSFGLAGIRERVALLGGTFDVTSIPAAGGKKSGRKRHGTEVKIKLPLTQ